MVESTWQDVEVPILESIYEFEQSPTSSDIDFGAIAESTGLDRETISRHARRLFENGYIDGNNVTTMGSGFALIEPRLTERGLRVVGAWPQDEYGELLRVLEARIASASDAEARSNLERVRDAVLGLGRDVGTSLLSAYVKSVTGLP